GSPAGPRSRPAPRSRPGGVRSGLVVGHPERRALAHLRIVGLLGEEVVLGGIHATGQVDCHCAAPGRVLWGARTLAARYSPRKVVMPGQRGSSSPAVGMPSHATTVPAMASVVNNVRRSSPPKQQFVLM